MSLNAAVCVCFGETETVNPIQTKTQTPLVLYGHFMEYVLQLKRFCGIVCCIIVAGRDRGVQDHGYAALIGDAHH